MRPAQDLDNRELASVLAALARDGIDITAREVARRHSTLKHASNFTRSKSRMALIDAAKQAQLSARAEAAKPQEAKVATLGDQLNEAKEKISALERQLASLVSSHTACVRAVMLHGGMQALERFWRDYQAIGEDVRALHALPDSAAVLKFPGSTSDAP